jgi:hypothetical protein
MGLISSPLRTRCGAEEETSTYTLCESESLASLRHVLYIWAPFLGPRGCLRVEVWGPSGTLLKEEGFLDLTSDYGAQSSRS